MGVQFFPEVIQGSDEWKRLRAGVPTASVFEDVMAKGEGKTRRTLLYKLVGERLTGEPADSFSNVHTARGNEVEPEARSLYSMMSDNEVAQVGFCLNDGLCAAPVGYSPDGLIGDDGLLELKSRLPHLQIELLVSGEVPTKHMPQIQGGMWVSGRQWIDFGSYCRGLPLFIKRVYRDELYIVRLKKELDSFISDMLELEQKIRSY